MFVSGAAGADVVETVEAHLKHCRACQRSCVEMRAYLQDVGSTLAVIATLGGVAHGAAGMGVIGQTLGIAGQLGAIAGQAAQSLRERIRELVLRLAGVLPGSGGESGMAQVAGISAAKVTVLCAGVAGVMTCAAAGVVPGISALDLGRHQPAVRQAMPVENESAADLSPLPNAAVKEETTPERLRRELAARKRRRARMTARRQAREEANAGVATSSPEPEPEFEAEATEVETQAPPSEPAPPASDGGGSSSGGSSGGESRPEFGL